MYNINVSDERSYSKQVLAIFKLFDHGETEGGTRAIPIGARAPKKHEILFQETPPPTETGPVQSPTIV